MGNDIPILPKAVNIESKSIVEEFNDLVKKDAWPIVYRRISLQSQTFPYIEARKPCNRPLNRYRDVNPYDHSRVVLKRYNRDYINANFVNMERAGRCYILTQGPLPTTVGHFWLMVWEQNSQAILMLNKIVEKKEMKCHRYWPEAVGVEHKIIFDDVNLSVEQIKEEDCDYYFTRIFRVTDLETSTVRQVVQYHYTTWPDFGVPSSPVAFLKFLKRVRQSGVLESKAGPPVIHCSAGIGRSGTFCLVDSCLVIIEKEGVDKVDIPEVLLDLRRDRMGLIQTPDQLRFSYQAIIEGIKRLDPNFKEEEEIPEVDMDNEIYATVADDEQTPPLPPPRTESLACPPARRLPPIPRSDSTGDLGLTPTLTQDISSHEPDFHLSMRKTKLKYSSPEDDDSPIIDTDRPADRNTENSDPEKKTNLLHRRRVYDHPEQPYKDIMPKPDSGKWPGLKKFLRNPVTILCGVVAAGFIIYIYAKR